MEHAGISVGTVKSGAVEGASHVAQMSLRLRGLEGDCQVTRTVFPLIPIQSSAIRPIKQHGACVDSYIGIEHRPHESGCVGLRQQRCQSITVVPPTDELKPVLHVPNLRAGGSAKISIEVHDAAGRPVQATLVLGVVRLATAKLQSRPQGSIYDAIWSAWGYYQPSAVQSWGNVNASPTSYLHPTPTPRPSGLPYPTTIGRVVSETTAPPVPSASEPQGPPPSLDTILWATGVATTEAGHATVNITWPKDPDAYQVRVIALAPNGDVGVSELAVLVR